MRTRAICAWAAGVSLLPSVAAEVAKPNLRQRQLSHRQNRLLKKHEETKREKHKKEKGVEVPSTADDKSKRAHHDKKQKTESSEVEKDEVISASLDHLDEISAVELIDELSKRVHAGKKNNPKPDNEQEDDISTTQASSATKGSLIDKFMGGRGNDRNQDSDEGHVKKGVRQHYEDKSGKSTKRGAKTAKNGKSGKQAKPARTSDGEEDYSPEVDGEKEDNHRLPRPGWMPGLGKDDEDMEDEIVVENPGESKSAGHDISTNGEVVIPYNDDDDDDLGGDEEEELEYVMIPMNSSSTPIDMPTDLPSRKPTTEAPITPAPTDIPTLSPITPDPTDFPTLAPLTPFPTISPSSEPTTKTPSYFPTVSPSNDPTLGPTEEPSFGPTTDAPTGSPTESPTFRPSSSPSTGPTRNPTNEPTNSPSSKPTPSPTDQPTNNPSAEPTSNPTPLPYCPPAYDGLETNYMPGQLVQVDSFIFKCHEDPEYTVYCSINEWDDALLAQDENAKEKWDGAWIEVSPCYTTETPTESPSSDEPTTSPSLSETTSTPASSPLGTVVESVETLAIPRIPINPPSMTLPEKRYIKWAELDSADRILARDYLGYNKVAWNTPGTFEVETWVYADLYEDERAGAEGLGLEREMWDCHINHYQGYWWSDLVQLDLDRYFTVLGWDIEKWDDGTGAPETDDMTWDELSPEQQAVAEQLCYNRDLWNILPLAEWQATPQRRLASGKRVVNTVPEKRFIPWTQLDIADKILAKDNLGYARSSWNIAGTNDIETWSYSDLYDNEIAGAQGLGIDQEMWDCHINHYHGYWWSDLERLGIDQHYSVLGWNIDSWDNELYVPETEDMYWDGLTPEQQVAATQICFHKDLWDGIPLNQWQISPITDSPSLSPHVVVEQTIGAMAATSDVASEAALMTTNPTKKPSTSPTLRPTTPEPTLAPQQPSSSPTIHPTTLPSEQPSSSPTNQPTDVPTSYVPTYQPSSSPTFLPTMSPVTEEALDSSGNPASINIPEKRFVAWTSLSVEDKQTAVTNLGYARNSWDVPGTNSVEAWRYSDLYEVEIAGAEGLGIDEQMWDCYINHYSGYWWEDLEQIGIDTHFSILGWTLDMWDWEESIPETEDMSWDELTPEQQIAATQICYRRDAWDMVPLSEWESITISATENPTKPPSLAPTRIPSASPNSSEQAQLAITPRPKRTSSSASPSGSIANNLSDEVYLAPRFEGTSSPSSQPTISSTTSVPTSSPIQSPSTGPTASPTTMEPTEMPSDSPSSSPTLVSSGQPTLSPSNSPSSKPTLSPTTTEPTTDRPSISPTRVPSMQPTEVPSPAPSSSPSNRPTVSPTLGPTRKPSDSPTILPSSKPSYPPSPSPTDPPSEQPTTVSSSPTQKPSHAVMEQPINEPEMALLTEEIRLEINPAALTRPEQRYVKWSLLDDEDIGYATSNLGYDQRSWNNPGSAGVELWSYHDLYENEMTGLQGLGMNDEMWDCHINHYYGYWWEDVEYYGYDKYFTVLGWDVNSWDNDSEEPYTEDLYWDELSTVQQEAATQLCFFRELWDGESLTTW